MSEFLMYVLSILSRAIWVVVPMAILAAGILVIAYTVHKRKFGDTRKFPWGRISIWMLFIAYIMIVLFATLLRTGGMYRSWNLHLFRAWREAWNNFSAKNWANVLLNVAMFLPMGFLLPLLSRKLRKWYLTIPAGFTVSLLIELTQLAVGRGICDVDDLFANALGAAMGYFAIMAFLSLWQKKRHGVKQAALYAGGFLLPVAIIAGIVVCYHCQEYGNLPNAPAYTQNVRNTSWIQSCQLPHTDGTAPVYRTNTASKADCDAIAAEMAARLGEEMDMVSYYQEMAYYHFSRSIFMVYYYDSSTELICGIGETDPTGTPRERWEVVDALSAYGYQVPDAAEFSMDESGRYIFTCESILDGDTLLDGTLTCWLEADGNIASIYDHLVRYSYYQDTSIITAHEALERLCNGKFYDNGYFEYVSPESVSINGCTLGYAIDTKGFYQPVYYFDVLTEGVYEGQIMIPAMK